VELACWFVASAESLGLWRKASAALPAFQRAWPPSLEYSMDQTHIKSVDEYIASQPEAVQRVLKRVRNTIRKAVPGAEEVISYKIPAYKLHGVPVLYLAGWKQHYSLYPATARLVAAFKDDLAPYQVSKGTIRFPLSEPVPVKLIERIAKFRAKEVAERENAKSAAPKKR
jgi:uncharacterized protein YdhG (YjbR/CyaY superfamily)